MMRHEILDIDDEFDVDPVALKAALREVIARLPTEVRRLVREAVAHEVRRAIDGARGRLDDGPLVLDHIRRHR